MGNQSPPLMTLTRYYLISGFFNNFAPANLAGDVTRIGALYREGASGVTATSSVVIERILNLVSLCVLSLWAISLSPLSLVVQLNINVLPWIIVGAIGMGALVIGLRHYWPNQFRSWMIQIKLLMRAVPKHPYDVGLIIVETLALHFVIMLIAYSTFRAVGIQLPLDVNLAAYALAGLAIALPLSIQGIGVREGVYLGLLEPLGISRESILAALALNYLVLIVYSVIGAILFMVGSRRARSQAR
jgi:uncharacterized membrane protein YbhN (UPF0104 family)